MAHRGTCVKRPSFPSCWNTEMFQETARSAQILKHKQNGSVVPHKGCSQDLSDKFGSFLTRMIHFYLRHQRIQGAKIRRVHVWWTKYIITMISDWWRIAWQASWDDVMCSIFLRKTNHNTSDCTAASLGLFVLHGCTRTNTDAALSEKHKRHKRYQPLWILSWETSPVWHTCFHLTDWSCSWLAHAIYHLLIATEAKTPATQSPRSIDVSISSDLTHGCSSHFTHRCVRTEKDEFALDKT